MNLAAVPKSNVLRDRLPEAVNAASPAELLVNIEYACTRGLRQMPKFPENDRELVICAGGPSLRRSLPEIRQRARRGAFVLAVNASSGYLLENDICGLLGVVLLDPQDVLTQQFTADKRVSYFVASQCHPSIFDKLDGHEVLLWHAQDCGAEFDLIKRHYRDPVVIAGGTTAALRTFGIGHAFGFRKIHVYGLDGSFEASADGWLQHHAYQQPEDEMPECIIVYLEGDEKQFLTRPDYARQADEFMDVVKLYNNAWKMGMAARLQVFVHGDGLIPYIWRKRRHELS